MGDTNVRSALMNSGEMGAIDHLKVADFPSVREVISTFVQRRIPHRRLDAAVSESQGCP
jgi:glucokinase